MLILRHGKLPCPISLGCWIFILFVGVPASLGSGFSEKPPNSLRVATVNLRNYLLMDRHLEGAYRRDYPKPEAEKKALRTVLHEVGADILAMQEMGDEPFLRELQRDLAAEGLEYPHRVWMRSDDPLRHLAVLSRMLPDAVLKHDQLDFPYVGGRLHLKRGLLELRFGAKTGEPWVLYVVHLKSRLTDHPEDPGSGLRRTREAQAVRDFLRHSEDPQRPSAYLLAGDFNDRPNSPPLRRFLSVSGESLATLVPATDSRGEVWTYYNENAGVYERIDYFIASPEMFPRIHQGRAHIVDHPQMKQASDHRLLFLDLIQPQ
jgi:endonuclease/exonuclease/phosphatase family metal-dependent hydrolase